MNTIKKIEIAMKKKMYELIECARHGTVRYNEARVRYTQVLSPALVFDN